MKKAIVTISYEEEKLAALRLYLGQKQMEVEDELVKALEGLYCKNVPAGVRDFFVLRSGTVASAQPKIKKSRGEKNVSVVQEGQEHEQH